jgi:excisionase family DNA binding protein
MSNDYKSDEWITTAEAAKLAGYKPAHIRYLVKEGHVIGQKFGRDWMINQESIQSYVRKMKELGPAKYDPWRTGARQRQSEDS